MYRKRFVPCLALLVLTAVSGCTSVHDVTISTRNRWFAFNAWREANGSYKEAGAPPRIRRHIGQGFRDGYYSVASGGGGATPMFPPTNYWGVWFANPRGYDQVQAYFAGYQDGTVMAGRDGVGNWIEIPTSRRPPEADLANQGFIPGEPLPPGTIVPPAEPYMEELPPQDVRWPALPGETVPASYQAPVGPVGHTAIPTR